MRAEPLHQVLAQLSVMPRHSTTRDTGKIASCEAARPTLPHRARMEEHTQRDGQHGTVRGQLFADNLEGENSFLSARPILLSSLMRNLPRPDSWEIQPRCCFHFRARTTLEKPPRLLVWGFVQRGLWGCQGAWEESVSQGVT